MSIFSELSGDVLLFAKAIFAQNLGDVYNFYRRVDWHSLGDKFDIFLKEEVTSHNSYALVCQGRILKKVNLPLARDYWFRAAFNGNPIAQNYVGKMYFKGKGATFSVKLAREYWTEAANQGHGKACYHLGKSYINHNFAEGYKWMKMAANLECAAAQYKIAKWHGLGCFELTIDSARAQHWHIKAAKQGHLKAQHELGITLFKTKKIKGLEWILKAAKNKYEPSLCFLSQNCAHFVDLYFELKKELKGTKGKLKIEMLRPPEQGGSEYECASKSFQKSVE